MRALVAVAGACVMLAPALAFADGASEELAVGGAPDATWVSDKLGGTWDASDVWQVRLDLSATRAGQGDVLLASASAEYTIDTHWTVRGSAGWSPESATFATQHVDMTSGGTADAALRASSSSVSLGASIGYETGGDSDREMSAGLSATATYFNSQQEITSVRDDTGQMYDLPAMRLACASGACSDELASALWPQWAQLGQYALDASVSETLDSDTDLSLDAAYYLYDRDPQKLGYFALATVGRGTLGNATGVAPTEFTVTPSVAERWGNLAATASLAYGGYLEDQGYELGANLRVQYKLKLDAERRLKVYGKLGSSWHVNPENELAQSGSLALGVQYSW